MIITRDDTSTEKLCRTVREGCEPPLGGSGIRSQLITYLLVPWCGLVVSWENHAKRGKRGGREVSNLIGI